MDISMEIQTYVNPGKQPGPGRGKEKQNDNVMTFEHTERFGVQPLVESLRNVMPYKPWNHIPKGKPCKRADLYFQGITGRPWSVLLAMIDEYDHDLATKIEAQIPAAAKHGGDRRSAQAKGNQVDIINSKKSKGGTSKEYLLARIKRDFPEIAQAYEDGEYKSVRQAAIEAGFRKPKQQVIPEPENVQQFLERHLPGWDLVQMKPGWIYRSLSRLMKINRGPR